MSGEPILLDSVILIDHFNGISAATAYLAESAARARVSAITRAEVLTGFEDEELAGPRALLDRLRFVPIDADVADLAARLRRQRRWKLPDALQAATALQHGLRLVTRNTKDFSPSQDPFVLVPYTLNPGAP